MSDEIKIPESYRRRKGWRLEICTKELEEKKRIFYIIMKNKRRLTQKNARKLETDDGRIVGVETLFNTPVEAWFVVSRVGAWRTSVLSSTTCPPPCFAILL